MKIYDLLPLTKRKLEVLFEIYSHNRTYLRAISRELNISPSLCSRILKSLIKAKVLDKKGEGKQVYYSLVEDYYKEIIISILEEYHLERIAKSNKLNNFINLIRSNKEILDKCKNIYIFGSYARGVENKKSDLDVLFITKDKNLIAKFCRESSIMLNVSVNGIVMDEKEFDAGLLLKKDPLLSSILNEVKNRLVVK